MLDIVGIGESDIDLFIRVENVADKGGKVRGEEIGHLPGGIIGNFCSAVDKHGVRCGIVSAIGDDEYGRIALADYQKRGINLDGLMIIPGQRTFYCIVYIDAAGEKYLTAVVTPIISPPLDLINYSYIRSAKIAHMCSMDYELVERVAYELTDSDTAISLDYEGHADRAGFGNWKNLLKSVRYLFVNEEGLLSLLPDANPDEPSQALRSVFELGVEKVIYTCSDRGGHLYTKEKHLTYKAYKIDKISDTTGAGDCFNAAFLCAMIKEYPLEYALSYAAAAAALSIRHVGARTGLPSTNEIKAFLCENPEFY